MTAPVYIAPAAAAVAPGERVTLTGEEGHHAATVRRTRLDDALDLIDGKGHRARCLVVGAKKSELELEVREVFTEEAPALRVTVVQALAKGGRDEQAVETSTEFGAMAFLPWESQRTIVSWKNKEEKGRNRWQATAKAATKQSRRSWIPTVENLHSSRQLAARVKSLVEEGGYAYLCHEEAAHSLVQEINESSLPKNAEVWFLIGPEGGVSPDEVELLTQVGARAVLLGAHVLRSATAGAYALATLAALSERYEASCEENPQFILRDND